MHFIVDQKVWEYVTADGEMPPPRANHSSSVIKNTLYIFGGWDGSRRLNDLYQLDTGMTIYYLISRVY